LTIEPALGIVDFLRDFNSLQGKNFMRGRGGQNPA